MRKCWTKGRLKVSWENFKLCITISEFKTLFRSLTPLSFAECNTLLSLGLVLLPVSCSPWQIFHNSDIPNILGSSLASVLLLLWLLKQCLKHSTDFLIHSPEVHISSSKSTISPVSAIPQFCFHLAGSRKSAEILEDILSVRNLKAHPHLGIFLLTRSYSLH